MVVCCCVQCVFDLTCSSCLMRSICSMMEVKWRHRCECSTLWVGSGVFCQCLHSHRDSSLTRPVTHTSCTNTHTTLHYKMSFCVCVCCTLYITCAGWPLLNVSRDDCLNTGWGSSSPSLMVDIHRASSAAVRQPSPFTRFTSLPTEDQRECDTHILYFLCYVCMKVLVVYVLK